MRLGDIYHQGFRDAQQGKPMAEDLVVGKRAYKAGYQASKETRASAKPRAEIILRVDAASYLRHYEEQDGEIADLANMIKHDAIKAVADMDLSHFAADLVIDRGKNDVITSVDIKDGYEDLNEDDEPEIEEVAQTQ